MLWTHKYAPVFEEIPHDTKDLLNYVTTYSKQKKKALLLHGPTGTGKTAAVHALARKLDLELVEINASDYRTADEINAKVGMALKQMSLFSKGKLILVDELDGIAGNEDRGGVGAIVELIADAKFPVVLTANDAHEPKLKSLLSKCVLIEFPALGSPAMLTVFKRILDKEKQSADENLLKSLARRSGGDLRGALIDLQILSFEKFAPASVDTLHERAHTESIMHALVKILKSTDPQVAISALDTVDEDLDEAFLWIDENLPREYTAPADLARAYQALSKADVYRGRIRRWQYYRYLVYVSTLITAGVAVAKDKKSSAFVQYQRTGRLLKIWMANQKYAKRKAIAQKLGAATHCSTKKALQNSLPHIRGLFQKKHASAALIAEELKLDEEQVEWLSK